MKQWGKSDGDQLPLNCSPKKPLTGLDACQETGSSTNSSRMERGYRDAGKASTHICSHLHGKCLQKDVGQRRCNKLIRNPPA